MNGVIVKVGANVFEEPIVVPIFYRVSVLLVILCILNLYIKQ